jgi:hypothetical protein
MSTEEPLASDGAADVQPSSVPPTIVPTFVPQASVAPLDYQLEARPVSRRLYRRVLWLCGAGWLALALVVGSYAMWRARMITRVSATAAAAAKVAGPTPAMSVYRSRVIPDDRQDRRNRIKDLMTSGTRPATAVVYEEDPVAASNLLTSPSEYAAAGYSRSAFSMPQGYQPPAFIRALDIEPNGRMKATDHPPAELFRGGLTSPAGNRRLVRIALQMRFSESSRRMDPGEPKPHQVFSLARQFWFEIYRAGSDDWLAQVRGGESFKIVQPKGEDIPIRWVDGVLRADRAPEHNVRFYAGQLDPNDPSHFTIDYELNGARNVIDGWLTDDDFLRIRPRGGKVTAGDWRIAEKP